MGFLLLPLGFHPCPQDYWTAEPTFRLACSHPLYGNALTDTARSVLPNLQGGFQFNQLNNEN
jgi:hypothetical protein